MSQSPGICYALYGLWVVGILLMVATVLLTWVSIDAVTSAGGSAVALSGIDVMSMRCGDAVPGGTLGIVLVLYAFVSALLLVLTRMYPERLGLAGTQLLFAVMTVTVLLFLSDAGSGFLVQSDIPEGVVSGGALVDSVPPWVAGLFEGDVVSADVSYSMWRYLGAVGLLVSWLTSFYLLRHGDDGQRSV